MPSIRSDRSRETLPISAFKSGIAPANGPGMRYVDMVLVSLLVPFICQSVQDSESFVTTTEALEPIRDSGGTCRCPGALPSVDLEICAFSGHGGTDRRYSHALPDKEPVGYLKLKLIILSHLRILV